MITNDSGVYLPTFESYTEGANDFGLTGLGRGGQQVQRAIEVYSKAVETLVELASLQVPLVPSLINADRFRNSGRSYQGHQSTCQRS
jgi:hypothetical protein